MTDTYDIIHDAPRSAPDLPAIRVVPGELPRIVDQAEAALIAAGEGIYRRGGELVRPAIDALPAHDGTTVRTWRLLPVTPPYLVERLSAIAQWQRYDGRRRDWIPIDCPDRIAETYLARAGLWQVPPLIGVINTPLLRADGSLLDRPGYDRMTGLLYEPDGMTFPGLLPRATKDDAYRALALLEELIATYPFVAPVDRSVALSAILSALDRRALPTCPMHAFTAPVAGSGKSMLVDICSILATGRAAPVVDQSRDDAETDKRLVAALLRGSAIISLDNCERPIESSLLCQALTTVGVMQIRRLGVSHDVDIPNTAMIYATGNNLVVTGDLGRRTIQSRLDPQCERPELREFRSDPLRIAASDRGRYVAAALIVLHAYQCADESVTCTPIGSFGDWSRRVREPLIWLGRDDPCASMVELRGGDPVTATLAALITAWRATIGVDRPVTTRALIDMAERVDLGGAPAHPELRESLLTIAGEGHDTVNSRRLGRWLARIADRIINRCRISAAGQSCHVGQWILREG